VVVGDILQPTHLLFVLVVALLVLGPKRLPEVGRSLGRTMRDFRSAISGQETHDDVITETVPQPTPPAPPAPATAPTEPAASAPEPKTEPGAAPAADAHAGDSSAEQAATQRQPTPAP
jgi:sec-independent protein translocase protein TatA